MQNKPTSISKVVTQAINVSSSLYRRAPFAAQKLASFPVLRYLQNVGFNGADISFLQNKVVCIDISDLELRQFFGLKSNNIELLCDPESVDVTFKGRLSCFLQLLTQSSDPDTLFFQRKLSITGNTELGLEVKALFEQIEFKRVSPLIQKFFLTLQQYL